MREILRPVLFADEDQESKKNRNPVSPAKRSAEAMKKTQSKLLPNGKQAQSFHTLLKLQSTIVRNLCRIPHTQHETKPFLVTTTPTKEQQRVYDLLKLIKM